LGLIGEESAGNYFSYHFDYRGSTIAITNITGQLVDSVEYSPFGVVLSQPIFDTPFLFNGLYGVMTDGNNLNYMRARYYSADLRRFVNQDVLLGNVADGQSLNRFAFVTGNPVSFVDPFGLEEVQPEILNPTITKEDLDSLFNAVKQMDLALNYPSAGCEARAYIISNTTLASLHQPYQVWLFNERNNLTLKGKNYGWNFHTATMVKLEDGTRMVIDLVASPNQPITVEEWKALFSGIQNSSEEKFGTPPLICEGAKPCRYRRLDGSYVPNKKDSDFSSLEKQAINTLQCYGDIHEWYDMINRLFNQHCRAMQ
jgi:RHS repeat-associated protein